VSPEVVKVQEGADFNGMIAEIYDPTPSQNMADYTVSINWGDGPSWNPDVTGGSVQPEKDAPNFLAVTEEHSYADSRAGETYNVNVTVTKDDDQPETASSTINIVEAPLTGTPLTIDGTQGVPLTNVVVASFTDADPNAKATDYSASITWGDPTLPAAGHVYSNGQGGFNVTGSHTYSGSGTFSVNVQIYDASPNPITVVSTANVEPGVPAISITDAPPVLEGNSGTTNATFTVSVSSSSNQPITVHWATADGSATIADNDYQAAYGDLTFQPGGPLTQKIAVQVNGDTKPETDETFLVNLTNASPNAAIGRSKATGTIVNDDPIPLSIGDASPVKEGDTGTTSAVFTISLAVPSSQPVTVHWATADGTATTADNDYIGICNGSA
jgi:hypothetical protein